MQVLPGAAGSAVPHNQLAVREIAHLGGAIHRSNVIRPRRRLSPVACCRSGLARFSGPRDQLRASQRIGRRPQVLARLSSSPKLRPSSGLRKRIDWGRQESALRRARAPFGNGWPPARWLTLPRSCGTLDSRCADEQRRDRDPTRAETIARQSTIPEKVASTRVSLRTGSSPRCRCSCCSESPGMTLRRQQRRPQGNPRSLGSQLKGNPPKCDTL